MGERTMEGRREKLPNEARDAVEFVNTIYKSLSPEKKAKWTKDIQVALLGLRLNIRPAVFMDFSLDDPDTIQHYLDQKGVNGFVYRDSMIVDRNLVLQRIVEESDFAQLLGWQEGMTVDEWLAQADPGGDGRQRGIIGFFLGFPKTAVEAYMNKEIENPAGVDIQGPYGGRVLYFTTDAKLVDAEDVQALKSKSRAVFEKAGFGQFFSDKSSS